MSKSIIICGTGKAGELLFEDLRLYNIAHVEAFTADQKYIKTQTFKDLPLVCFDNVEEIYPPQEYDMLIALSYREMRYRGEMFIKAKEKGYYLPNCIFPDAKVYPDLIIGENNIICSDTYLGPYGQIGNNNIIRQKTYIGHNFRIASHVYISPGCIIGGYSQIDDLSFIAIGSVVKERIHIARETLLGAGSLLLNDTEESSQYFGHPCKKIKEHKEFGIVLD